MPTIANGSGLLHIDALFSRDCMGISGGIARLDQENLQCDAIAKGVTMRSNMN